MYCLLNDVMQWDQYMLAALHWWSIGAILFGVYKLLSGGRTESKR